MKISLIPLMKPEILTGYRILSITQIFLEEPFKALNSKMISKIKDNRGCLEISENKRAQMIIKGIKLKISFSKTKIKVNFKQKRKSPQNL